MAFSERGWQILSLLKLLAFVGFLGSIVFLIIDLLREHYNFLALAGVVVTLALMTAIARAESKSPYNDDD